MTENRELAWHADCALRPWLAVAPTARPEKEAKGMDTTLLIIILVVLLVLGGGAFGARRRWR